METLLFRFPSPLFPFPPSGSQLSLAPPMAPPKRQLALLLATIYTAARTVLSRSPNVRKTLKRVASGLPRIPATARRGTKGQVTVFCGASFGTSKDYVDGAREMGKIIGESGYSMLYGGGRCGLMGEVSGAAHDVNPATVVGIIPEFLRPTEGCEASYGHDITVDTMHERMQLLTHRSKAFIALPGGYGTLAELLEVITAKQLGQIDGDVRIGVLNINGFYDGLLAFFKQAEEAGFLRLKGGIHVVSEPTAERLWKSLCL